MMNNYVIDKVPYDLLEVGSQKDYGKVYYCHMRKFPYLPVYGPVGTREYAQSICDMYNYKSKKSR